MRVLVESEVDMERLGDAVSYVERHGFGVYEEFDNLILSAASTLAEGMAVQ